MEIVGSAGLHPAAVAPVTAPRDGEAVRFVTLDAIRGFAVFGILLRNIFLFGLPASAYAMPYLWGEHETANIAAWMGVELFVDGAMRGLFSILFGASALIILAGAAGGRTDVAAVDRYYRRLLVLIGLGLAHAYLLLWPYDILYAYGVFGLLLFPLRNASPRLLLSLAAIVLVVAAAANSLASGEEEDKAALARNMLEQALAAGIVIEAVDGTDGSEDGPEGDSADADAAPADGADAGAEDQGTATSSSESDELEELYQTWEADVLSRMGGYLENFSESAGGAFEQQTSEMFRTHLADIGALMLVGMALFKLGVLTGRRSRRFYLGLASAGYGIGLAVNLLETLTPLGYGPAALSEVSFTDVTYDIGRIGVALGHLSAVVLAVRSGLFGFAVDLFAASGRMALTTYVTQSAICIFLFYGFGLGLFAAFEHYELLAIAAFIGFAQMVFARLWLARFAQGPIEWLVRRLAAVRPEREDSA